MSKPVTPPRRDDPIGKVVAGNLRQLRRSRGWTQAQTATRLAPYIGGELTGAAISQWEDGRKRDRPVRRVSVTELWAICKVFDVDLARLLMPGLWESHLGEAPDLFGEPYSSVWMDCFSGLFPNESAAEYVHRRMWTSIGSQVAASPVDEAPVDAEFTHEELTAAARLLRQAKGDS